jgi:hypothetical protein
MRSVTELSTTSRRRLRRRGRLAGGSLALAVLAGHQQASPQATTLPCTTTASCGSRASDRFSARQLVVEPLVLQPSGLGLLTLTSSLPRLTGPLTSTLGTAVSQSLRPLRDRAHAHLVARLGRTYAQTHGRVNRRHPDRRSAGTGHHGLQLAPPSAGVKRTAPQLAALGPNGLVLTPAAGQAGCARTAGVPAVPTTCPNGTVHASCNGSVARHRSVQIVSIAGALHGCCSRGQRRIRLPSGDCGEWAVRGSNARPPACKAGALTS